MVRVHRSIAIVSVFIIMFTAITGFLLQHAEDFNWHQKSIEQSWLLDLYDVQPAVPTTYQVVNKPNAYATQLAHQWYINTQMLAVSEGQLKGAVYLQPFWVLANENRLYLYSNTFELVEQISPELDGVITAIGAEGNKLVVTTASATYQADEGLISFEKESKKQHGKVSMRVPTPPEHMAILPRRVSDIRYLRLMQDLHGGRLFGLPHWLIPDFTAFSLLFLSISGLLMRKKRRAI